MREASRLNLSGSPRYGRFLAAATKIPTGQYSTSGDEEPGIAPVAREKRCAMQSSGARVQATARPRRSAEQAGWKASVGNQIRVLIVDDHAVLRQALRLLLEAEPEVEVVGDAANGREALGACEKLLPDVVLMDMVMPGLNGLEATRQIRKRLPKTKVLILTGYMEDEQILGALQAGAAGYVVKKSDVKELLLGIQAVHRGNTYFSSAISDGDAVSQYLWQAKKGDAKAGYELLTGREREVLQLIAEGYSNQRIAQELYISVKTVEAHKAHIMSKLHAQNRTDLIRYAIRRGIVGLDPPPPAEDVQAREAG
jgi:DNA-binding NarL/FixJ family response regulator